MLTYYGVLRTLGNAGDGVSSAFPKGKQNEDINKTTIILTLLVYIKVLIYFKYLAILNSYNSLFILFMQN
jgi:hypothetical protein